MLLRFLPALAFVSFLQSSSWAGTPRIEREKFGTLADGTVIDQYTLTNGTLTVRIINYGAIVTNLVVSDRNQVATDIVLGYDDLKGYVDGGSYFGATVGRVANRIAGAKFTLDGKEYKLAANNGTNSLHGGKKGFDRQVWKATPRIVKDNPKLSLSYVSKDGEEGFPGELTVTVEYSLRDNSLVIDYTAYCDKATPVNLTHHSYFNLNGHNAGEVFGHELTVFADKYTPTDKDLIPTGKIEPVKGTPLDFTQSASIGSKMRESTTLEAKGYDHNFVLRGQKGIAEKACEVVGDKSRIKMLMLTSEPGLQFYTGVGLGKEIGKGGVRYAQYGALCLEPQHYPDSPNKPGFPSIILKPGQIYKQKTIHEFGIK